MLGVQFRDYSAGRVEIDVGHDDVAAGCRKSLGHRLAKTGASACDQDDPSLASRAPDNHEQP